MDLVYSVQDYVTRMTESVGGMKALLLDKETTAIVSMVYSRSKVLEKEVFLFQRLDAERRGEMLHLKAVVFLRPTRENVALLVKELHEPKFGEYHLFFSNVISNDAVRMLAQADEFELVKQLQEYYADFYALSPICCSLALPANSPLTMQLSERTRDGLFALLLAMKKKPAIRFQQSSKDAERVAALLSQHIDQHQETLDFSPAKGCDTPPLLLIVDRFDDPVTPLLNQWTYQAMIHELLGIRNNIVELPGDIAGKNGKGAIDSQQIVFSTETDDFYRDNLYTDYGQLHDRLMHALDAFKKANPTLQAVEDTRSGAPAFQSIAEMQKFVEKYPEMNKLKDCVAKHVNILHALSRIIEKDNIMEASELEQQLACVQDHKAAIKQVTAMVEGSTITDLEKLRLVLLFTLRYQKEAVEKGELAALLHHIPSTLQPDVLQLPHSHTIPQILLQLCGKDARTASSDLFNRGVSAVVMNGLSGLKGLSMRQGVEQDNAFMLHEPLLARLLRDLDRCKLSEEAYPYKACNTHKGLSLVETLRATKRGPTEIIVFIVGGATYAEARVVARWNEANKHLRVILGGTCFLNSSSFIQSLVARSTEQLSET